VLGRLFSLVAKGTRCRFIIAPDKRNRQGAKDRQECKARNTISWSDDGVDDLAMTSESFLAFRRLVLASGRDAFTSFLEEHACASKTKDN
jgi:hypothetical protein